MTEAATVIVIRNGEAFNACDTRTPEVDEEEFVYRYHHTIFPNVYAYQFEPTGEFVIINNGIVQKYTQIQI